ncbi:MAG: pyridoxamine 5'-phosphate oxidase family protein [Deltaproteobacteria bacterium HGW-Deltaproteobacteria-15]|jgi:predicted pyridoxine 5'-phosphate oxidase superfamily flavin-nucleotide-binding protein|nr:MAG: pyridoxamine 5'-phosphate oxidase family protein [Deltaproteobacteria bacterium HGW-Deltaproteobacteria-15]
MKPEVLERAIRLANRVGVALVATADDKGSPHVAASSKIEAEGHPRISVSEWFCPGTLSNLQVNPKISIVVWDPESDTGFQLLGESEGIQQTAVMNGLYKGPEEESPLPQVKRKIFVRVDSIIRFCHAPHSDLEE